MVNHREQERRGTVDRHRSKTSLDGSFYKSLTVVPGQCVWIQKRKLSLKAKLIAGNKFILKLTNLIVYQISNISTQRK